MILAVVVPAVARTAREAAPPFQVTPHELRLSKPVLQLAADDGRAAFAFCQRLVGVWRPGASGIVRLGRLNLWSDPSPTSPASIQTLAIARDRIAWAVDQGGNIVDDYTFVTTLAHLPCLPAALRLFDAARGLVAYTLAGKLHLLRLHDGADAVVTTADDARFGDTGLFYSDTATGAWPGRIRFIDWTHLPLQP